MEQLKSETLFMLRGNYLDDLLYLNFGMQLGIDLCEAINVYEEPCTNKNSPEIHRIDC